MENKNTSTSKNIIDSVHVHENLPPAGTYDPVIEAYKKDVDRTLIRENLKLTIEQRIQKLEDFVSFITDVREAGKKMRRKHDEVREEPE